jgi:hypothetical protein
LINEARGTPIAQFYIVDYSAAMSEILLPILIIDEVRLRVAGFDFHQPFHKLLL